MSEELRLGLIGENIFSSPSPQIHNYIYEKYDIKAKYNLYQIKASEFEYLIKNLLKENYGLNVTMPYKEIIIKYLKALSPEAEKTKAVNTIKDYIGFNTDYIAFKKLVKNKIKGKIRSSLILGAGGAARASAFALGDLGSKILIFNRTKERAEKLANDLLRDDIESYVIDNLKVKDDIDVIVNTIPVDFNFNLNPLKGYIDFVYSRFPSINTATIIDGKEILLYQAIEAEKIWFNLQFDEVILDNVRKLIW
ncbi:MAG: shikimate dehydrogenase family protein [Caldisphaera sp.]|jgi:shikimate dehydrogenase|nr:hypothetical protein [Caldisphaera sp.]PMP91527.1 MAG: shikimate dehydrogenase [Caldisphaera sp.]